MPATAAPTPTTAPTPISTNRTSPAIPTTATATAQIHPARRRLVAALLVLLTLAGVLGLTASPASAEAPGKLPMVLVRPYDTYIRVFWAPPADDGGEAITGYRVERWRSGKVGPEKTWIRSDTRALVDTTVDPDETYAYRVQALNADGDGEWTHGGGYFPLNPYVGPLAKFSGNATTFTTRQYQDLLGRQPGFGELNNTVLGLDNATIGPEDVIGDLAQRPERIDLRHPVIRLYFAYFDRAPDHGGLDYWLKKRAGGTKLDTVSAHFAGSSEFTTKYGSLSNQEFVTLVYQNVLKRDPDANGLAYWTGKLDAKSVSRGRVMTFFSESNEYRTKSKGIVGAADLFDDMLGTAIPSYELAKWGPHLQGGGTVGDLGTNILFLVAYQA